MKRVLFVVLGLILVLAVSGCITVSKSARERVDTQVAGNQGVIYGPTPAPHAVKESTRDVYDINVELPTKDELVTPFKPKSKSNAATDENIKTEPAQDRGVWGNAGSVNSEQVPAQNTGNKAKIK